MRSTRRDLDGVVGKFEGWRATRQGRAIPGELWDAAVGLLGDYKASVICRALGLNPSRFKHMREERRGNARRRAGGRRGALVGSRVGDGFVELAPPKVGLLGGLALCGNGTPGASGLRLTVESAGGTLSVVTGAPGPAWVEALSRLALSVLVDGSRA